jgi:hypothetical protein
VAPKQKPASAGFCTFTKQKNLVVVTAIAMHVTMSQFFI